MSVSLNIISYFYQLFYDICLTGSCLLAMCLTAATNGLEEECPAEATTDTKAAKLKKKQKKQPEVQSEETTTEETPLKKKKKKKRKLGDAAEPPGKHGSSPGLLLVWPCDTNVMKS